MRNGKRVYICSKYRGDVKGNVEKAIGYCKQVIKEGNIPIAPHLYFTQFLDDEVEEERKLGLQLGIEDLKTCDLMIVFGTDISAGMKGEMDFAKRNGISIEPRMIEPDTSKKSYKEEVLENALARVNKNIEIATKLRDLKGLEEFGLCKALLVREQREMQQV